eukprot:2609024-Alexandrium_andersonii.AAC.1
MSASLVGSEMCIRDSCCCPRCARGPSTATSATTAPARHSAAALSSRGSCLLYTSDAADDM